MKRNLIYYICPFKDNDEWRKNVQRLSRYLNVFNHRLIIAIAQGKGIESAEEVKKMFEEKRIEYAEVENDPVLCEVKPFMRLLKEVQSIDAEEITFYAHAKGVSVGHRDSKLKNIRIW